MQTRSLPGTELASICLGIRGDRQGLMNAVGVVYRSGVPEFANAGLINSKILNVMNPGAMVLNYDRGECVDVNALDAALSSGQIACAAIDADIFKSADGTLFGPLVPYLPLAKKYPNRVELLPHAAADRTL